MDLTWPVLSRLSSAGFSFLATLHIARTNTPELAGDILSSLAAVQVLSLLLSLGGGNSLVFFGSGTVQLARRGLRLAIRITATITVGSLVIVSLWRPLEPLWILLILASSAIAFLMHVSSCLASTEKFRLYYLCLGLQGALPLLASILGANPAPEWRTSAFLASYGVLALLLAISLLVPVMREKQYSDEASHVDVGRFLRYGVESTMGAMATAALYAFDILLIKAAVGGAEVGIYAIGSSLAKSSWLVVDSVALTLFPRIVNKTIGNAEIRRIVVFSLAFSICCAAIWPILGKSIVELVYGSDYLGSVHVAGVLLVGSIFMVFVKINTRIMLAYDQNWAIALVNSGSVAAGSAVCYFSNLDTAFAFSVATSGTYLLAAAVLSAVRKQRST